MQSGGINANINNSGNINTNASASTNVNTNAVGGNSNFNSNVNKEMEVEDENGYNQNDVNTTQEGVLNRKIVKHIRGGQNRNQNKKAHFKFMQNKMERDN